MVAFPSILFMRLGILTMLTVVPVMFHEVLRKYGIGWNRAPSDGDARLVNHIVATLGLKAGGTHPNPRLTHLNPHLFRHSIARFLKSKVFSAEWNSELSGS